MSKFQSTSTERVRRTDVAARSTGVARVDAPPSETYRRVFDAEMARRGLDADGNRIDVATSGDAESKARAAMVARSRTAWETTRDDSADLDQPSLAPVAKADGADPEAVARERMRTRSSTAWTRGEP